MTNKRRMKQQLNREAAAEQRSKQLNKEASSLCHQQRNKTGKHHTHIGSCANNSNTLNTVNIRINQNLLQNCVLPIRQMSDEGAFERAKLKCCVFDKEKKK